MIGEAAEVLEVPIEQHVLVAGVEREQVLGDVARIDADPALLIQGPDGANASKN